jgi:hypothetical protein
VLKDWLTADSSMLKANGAATVPTRMTSELAVESGMAQADRAVPRVR